MTADKPNTPLETTASELSAEQIARSIRMTRTALDHGADELPYEISERLRAIRVRALAQAQQNTRVHTANPANAITEALNWRGTLAKWFKGSVAVSAFALALMISVVSIRSELTTDVAVSDRAISMSASTSATSPVASSEVSPLQPMANGAVNPAHPNNHNALLSASNQAPIAQASRNPERNSPAVSHTYGAGKVQTIASASEALETTRNDLVARTAPSAVNSANSTVPSTDDEIGMILHEQIPLQAYLNDDFARFANHQGINSIEKVSNTTVNADPEQ